MDMQPETCTCPIDLCRINCGVTPLLVVLILTKDNQLNMDQAKKRMTAWPASNLVSARKQSTSQSTDHDASANSIKKVSSNPTVPTLASENTLQIYSTDPWASYKKYMLVEDYNAILVHHEPSDTIAMLSTIRDHHIDNNKLQRMLKIVHTSLASIHEICIKPDEVYIFSEYLDVSVVRLLSCSNLTEPQIANITKKVTKSNSEGRATTNYLIGSRSATVFIDERD